MILSGAGLHSVEAGRKLAGGRLIFHSKAEVGSAEFLTAVFVVCYCKKKKKGKKAEFKPKMLDKTPKFISTALLPGILVSGALNDRLDL